MNKIEDISKTRKLLGNLLLKRFFSSITSLAIEVGTNVPQGGDAGHGGRTLLRLEDVRGNAWDLYVETESRELLKFEYPRKVDIVLYGDSEGLTFIRGILWASKVLRRQVREQGGNIGYIRVSEEYP